MATDLGTWACFRKTLWTKAEQTIALICLQSRFMLTVYQDDVFCGVGCFRNSLSSGWWGPIWILTAIAVTYWFRTAVFWVGVAEFLLGPLPLRFMGDIYEPIRRIYGWPDLPEAFSRRLDMFAQVTLWPAIFLMVLGLVLAFISVGRPLGLREPEERKARTKRALCKLGVTLLLFLIVPVITTAIRRYLYIQWVPWK